MNRNAKKHWYERADAIRGDIVSDPAEAEFMAVVGQQLGITTSCPNCFQHQLNLLLGDRELYSYGASTNVNYHWDIETAKAIIIRDQLQPVELSTEVGWQLLIGHDATLEHVEHLPQEVTAEPIILADALPNNQFRSHALIDGTHRLLRLLRDGGQIRAYVLDRQRSQAARVSEDEIIHTGLTLFDRLSRVLRIR